MPIDSASGSETSAIRFVGSLARMRAVGVALIAIVTCLAYWPAIHGGLIVDDHLLLQNQLVKDPGGLYRIWLTTDAIDYWPVTNTLFWIEWRLWGTNPLGYHLVNLALHIAAALLVWAVLRELSIPGAYLAALLFAVHPVNVESVAWISQSKTVLAAVFFLLSIYAYLKADPPQPDAARTAGERFLPANPGWYWLSLAAFVLGMLSKASVATLPLVLLLVVWWRSGQITRRDVLRTVPFFLVVVPLVLVNMWFQDRYAHQIVRSVAERLAGAGAIPWFYLGKALWPLNLAFIYPQWEIDTGNPLWWLPLAASAAVTAALLWQRHTAWGRALLFAWGFYWLALAPVLGFADVSYMKWSLVADHYQYLAIISVVALVAAAITQAVPRYSAQATVPVAAALVALLAFLTWQQSAIYRDPITLYETTIKQSPLAGLAYNNLGKNLQMIGRHQDAIGYLEEARRLNPELDEAHNNLGNALLNTGRAQEAIAPLEEAMRLNPRYADAHVNLGVALFKTGHPQEAVAQLQEAARLRPDLPEAFCNLGAVLLNTGHAPEAIAALDEAVRLKPDYLEAWANLAFAHHRLGQLQQAATAADKALAVARAQQDRSNIAQRMENLLNELRRGSNPGPGELPLPALPPPTP